MRIVHIITRLIIGGAQENTLLSCEGQHDRGHEVTLITGPAVGPEGSLIERAKSYGYRVIVIDEMLRAIRPVQDIGIYKHIARIIGDLRPDVVHTHSSKGGIIGRWAADKARRSQGDPVIVHTIHGLAFTASTLRLANGFYKMLERKTAPLTDRIVCVADAMREQSLAAGVGEPGQYVTVYSGMETGPFLHPPVAREVTRRNLGLSDEHVVVGTIARLFELKGHEDLLDLAPRLCARFPNLRFLWVGDGVLRPAFERRIAEMNLKDRFVLTGLVRPEQIPELTAAMDIMVHPSRREGLARAIVQGQLSGRPAIAYDIDGNREGLIEGTTGFVVRPFDKEAMGERVVQLAADADLRRRMGEAGREFALKRFDSKIMVEALERVYASAKVRKQ